MKKTHVVFLSKDMLNKIHKHIYIYGSGALGDATGKWLSESGFTDYSFVVDDEYYIDNGNTDVSKWSQIEKELMFSKSMLIYSIGSSIAFKKFIEKGLVNEVYAIFNVYRFWTYKDIGRALIKQCLEKPESLYDDEVSILTLKGYIEAMRTGDGNLEMDNNPPYNPYFNELTHSIKDGAYVDIGAYTGDTIEAFREYYGDYNRSIYALEPDEKSFLILQKKYVYDTKVFCINKGAWSENTKLMFSASKNQRSEISEEGSNSIEVVSLDDLLADNKVSYLKIGNDYALEILKGSISVIERDMPIISLFAVYHFETLFEIPNYLHSIRNRKERYAVYLRHHSATTCGLLFITAVPMEDN